MSERKNKFIKWITESFDKKSVLRKDTMSWKGDYQSPYSKGFLEQQEHVSTVENFLVRDGLFSLFWHLYNQKKLVAGFLLPIESSVFLETSADQLFYQIKRSSKDNHQSTHLLIGLQMNPELFPLNMLEEGLELYQQEIKSFESTKVFIHLIMPSMSLHSLEGQAYVHAFYKVFAEKFGFIPELFSDLNLLRMSEMSQWTYYSPQSCWVVGDNYLEHFCLSKNARLMERNNQLELTSLKTSYSLSPFHQMNIGTCLSNNKKPFLVNRFESFRKLSTGPSTQGQIPVDFINLIYRTISK